jgi:hypothetical protein
MSIRTRLIFRGGFSKGALLIRRYLQDRMMWHENLPVNKKSGRGLFRAGLPGDKGVTMAEKLRACLEGGAKLAPGSLLSPMERIFVPFFS